MDHESNLLQELEDVLSSLKTALQSHKQIWSHELSIAERVQRSMLPGPVHHPKIDIDVRYVPLETVGGDYCQVLFPSDSCCYVTICDVAGHGIGPALLATRFSSEVRRLVLDELAPNEILRQVNKFVVDHFAATELFLTFFVAKFNLQSSIVTYSGAGHPGPLLIRTETGQIEVLHSQNIVIGLDDDRLVEWGSDQIEVGSGDRLIFFTDGLTETSDAKSRMLGVDGVVRMATITCAGSLLDVADCILEGLGAFRNGPPQDDLTLIIAELK